MTKQKTETTTAIVEKEKEFSIIGKLSKEEINFFNPTLSIRNDCKEGVWKIGDKLKIGRELDFAIIKVTPFCGKLGKSEGDWLQVWLIPAPKEDKLPANTVAVTYIKTRSMSQLGDALIMAMLTEDPGLLIWCTEFEKHAGEYGEYYSIDWSYREREDEEEVKQIEQIIKFLSTKPDLTDTRLPETMQPQYNSQY